MIVKMQPSRKHSSSFKRLREYLTQERDADTGELLLRGDVVMSENLLSFDTAAGEMQGVASLNDRCKDERLHAAKDERHRPARRRANGSRSAAQSAPPDFRANLWRHATPKSRWLRHEWTMTAASAVPMALKPPSPVGEMMHFVQQQNRCLALRSRFSICPATLPESGQRGIWIVSGGIHSSIAEPGGDFQ